MRLLFIFLFTARQSIHTLITHLKWKNQYVVLYSYIYISTTCAMCTCSGTIKTGLMFVILYNSDIIIWSIVNRVPMVPYCEK